MTGHLVDDDDPDAVQTRRLDETVDERARLLDGRDVETALAAFPWRNRPLVGGVLFDGEAESEREHAQVPHLRRDTAEVVSDWLVRKVKGQGHHPPIEGYE